MSLRIDHLRLRVATAGGLVGADLRFKNGLNVFRADNTRGKSTCMQSIIYALGLEGMLSASHEVPLPHVMTDRIEVNGTDVPVLESEVSLQIQNGKGEILSLTRSVKGERDKHLIRTWAGPLLTNPAGQYEEKDYFVRQPGGAKREAGFHHRLASFLGWELPQVARYDGSDVPLYLECIFPLMIVEQKRGWSAIQARMPLHYRIREVGKRAIEFVMALDANVIVQQREALREAGLQLRARWLKEYADASAIAEAVGGRVVGIPKEPSATWPRTERPDLTVTVKDTWVGAREALKQLRQRTEEIQKTEIPKVKQIAKQASEQLEQGEKKLSELDLVQRQLFDEATLEEAQLVAVQRRLVALREDLRKNQDVARLRKLGSVVAMAVTKGECPTCHQGISDTLLPQGDHVSPMSLDENIAFIQDQLATYRAVDSNATRVVAEKRLQLGTLRRQITELRAQIRSLKTTLVSDDRLPSEAAVQERVQVKQRIEQLERALIAFDRSEVRFGELAREYAAHLARLAELPAGDLSRTDESKLARLQSLMQQQARAYGVDSVTPESLGISRDVYRPVHEGFDLEFDLSASDMIRTIWAYLNGLLELAREPDFRTRHPGLLLFDEPQQQKTNPVSFASLLTRVSLAAAYQQQVIFATSEDRPALEPLLRSIPHTYLDFTGRVLKPIAATGRV